MKYLNIILLIFLIVGISKVGYAGVTITKVDKIYFVNLTGKIIHSVKPYQQLLKTLYSAKKGETVILNITSGGGSLNTGMEIIKALQNTKAYTIASVETGAYSMGAYLTCYTDRLSMKPGSELMFHHGSVILNGRWTITRLEDFVEKSLKLSNKLNTQCKLKGIINSKDIVNMDKGADVYVDANTVNKRLNEFNKGNRGSQ